MARTNRTSGTKASPASGPSGERPKRTRPDRSSRSRKPVRVDRRPPPVLSRYDSAGAVVPQKRASAKSRRRYDVALSIPGAEVRLPALPEIKIGWRIASGLLVLGLAALLYFIWTDPMFRISAVQVDGLQYVPVEDVRSVLDLEGETVFAVNPLKMQAELAQTFQEMSAITVVVELPASVVVTVTERQPVLHWKEDGEEAWIDQNGLLFPNRGEIAGLPVIVGDLPFNTVPEPGRLPQRSIDPQIVSDILAIRAYAPPGEQVMYEGDHGLGWRDPRGWLVFFGMSGSDAREMEMKLKVYAALVERLDQEGIGPTFISVEYLHAPYFRTER